MNPTNDIEAVFKAGYKAGFDQGTSDACAYEWGSVKRDPAMQKDKEQAWKEFQYDVNIQDNPPMMPQDPPSGN